MTASPVAAQFDQVQRPPVAPLRPPSLLAIQTLVCLCCLLLGWSFSGSSFATWAYVAAYAAGGAATLAAAARTLASGQVGIDLLMLLAALGAAVIGDWVEGGVLLFLFSLSNTLEAYATYRTRRSIESLMQLRPSEASVVRDGEELRVGIATLEIGDVIRLRPGERVAVDGEVIEGETWIDEATITGESEPVYKPVESSVFAGTMNGRGSVLVRMTRAASDTALERIVRMVQEAQAKKDPTQRFVEAWQQPYVLAVLLGAAATFAGAWLLHTKDIEDAFYHAMVLLVVASPCAVVIGAPAVILSAIARAARHGVLFKGGRYLELLGGVDVVAFDKTGTITQGRPTVAEIWTPPGVAAETLLRLAAAVEQRSEHHLAEAVLEEAERRGLDLPAVTEFESHMGAGVHGHVDRAWVGVGRETLFETHEVAIPETVRQAADRLRNDGQTVLLVVAPQENVCGVLALSDLPRANAADALASLKRLGVRSNIILTGDHERVAQSIARQVGADEVCAGLLPDEKVLRLRRLLDSGKKLAMVGDGVNDAPALATAQVGIAMGGAGTDVALEVADVVLMSDDLKALAFAVWISRRARRRIRQNLAFAAGVIGLLILLSFMNLPLWAGVLGHEGSTVLVVLNGLRLLVESPRSL
ncbi:MAG TPA: heavy metal translocating P-type ATPase [Pirellulales bacterium]|nr:heavy metal translocating P-type ATPase [Pirellulales bacterium]